MRAGGRAQMPLDPSRHIPPADHLKVTPEYDSFGTNEISLICVIA